MSARYQTTIVTASPTGSHLDLIVAVAQASALAVQQSSPAEVIAWRRRSTPLRVLYASNGVAMPATCVQREAPQIHVHSLLLGTPTPDAATTLPQDFPHGDQDEYVPASCIATAWVDSRPEWTTTDLAHDVAWVFAHSALAAIDPCAIAIRLAEPGALPRGLVKACRDGQPSVTIDC